MGPIARCAPPLLPVAAGCIKPPPFAGVGDAPDGDAAIDVSADASGDAPGDGTIDAAIDAAIDAPAGTPNVMFVTGDLRMIDGLNGQSGADAWCMERALV